jgi:hypothetical protein
MLQRLPADVVPAASSHERDYGLSDFSGSMAILASLISDDDTLVISPLSTKSQCTPIVDAEPQTGFTCGENEETEDLLGLYDFSGVPDVRPIPIEAPAPDFLHHQNNQSFFAEYGLI